MHPSFRTGSPIIAILDSSSEARFCDASSRFPTERESPRIAAIADCFGICGIARSWESTGRLPPSHFFSAACSVPCALAHCHRLVLLPPPLFFFCFLRGDNRLSVISLYISNYPPHIIGYGKRSPLPMTVFLRRWPVTFLVTEYKWVKKSSLLHLE